MTTTRPLVRLTLAAVLAVSPFALVACGDDGATVREISDDSGSESGSSSGSGSGSGSSSSSEPADE